MTAAVFWELALSACATPFTPGPNNILLLSIIILMFKNWSRNPFT